MTGVIGSNVGKAARRPIVFTIKTIDFLCGTAASFMFYRILDIYIEEYN
jgi:hypothetical protein